MSESKIKLAVIDGWHPYQVKPFHELFRSFDDVDYYLQFFENWGFNGPDESKEYDVLLFYNMTMQFPPEGDAFRECIEASLGSLGTRGQGLVILHHALLSVPERDDWSEIVGIKNRRFGFYPDQRFTVNVVDKDHPITNGMQDWEMIDETYTMDEPSEEEGSGILLTVAHEKSMKAIAWTRQYKESPVFCLQSGHDSQTWTNPNFRKVLHRGIQWAAGRLT